MGQCWLLEYLLERKFRGNFPGDIFQGEVSLNPPNDLTTVQIFQHIQDTFNGASTKYSSLYKSFDIVQIIKHS